MPLHVGKREPDAREQLDPADSAGTRLRPGRGRHPSDHVRASILAAAGRVLLEEGLAAFTIERVAAQAGASKTTIYKWWASRGALAFDGFFNALEATLAFPRHWRRRARPRHPDAGLHPPDYPEARRPSVGGAHRPSPNRPGPVQGLPVPLCRATTPARRRGDAAGPDTRTTARRRRPGSRRRPALGSCYYRLLIPVLPLDEHFAASLVHNLLQGLRPDSPATTTRATHERVTEGI